jgi:hypothetical protein
VSIAHQMPHAHWRTTCEQQFAFQVGKDLLFLFLLLLFASIPTSAREERQGPTTKKRDTEGSICFVDVEEVHVRLKNSDRKCRCHSGVFFGCLFFVSVVSRSFSALSCVHLSFNLRHQKHRHTKNEQQTPTRETHIVAQLKKKKKPLECFSLSCFASQLFVPSTLLVLDSVPVKREEEKKPHRKTKVRALRARANFQDQPPAAFDPTPSLPPRRHAMAPRGSAIDARVGEKTKRKKNARSTAKSSSVFAHNTENTPVRALVSG